WWSAEYWHGSLYVHCHNDILMILHCFECTYELVQLPGEAHDARFYEMPTRSILASQEKGIRYAALDDCQLQVWSLAKSSDGLLGWMLEHEADLDPYMVSYETLAKIKPRVTWDAVKTSKKSVILCQHGYSVEGLADEKGHHDTADEVDDDDNGVEEEETESIEGSEHSWDSDEDNFIDIDIDKCANYAGPALRGIMGLHPHKDVLLLNTSSFAMAYHLSTSRMQYLGERLVRDPCQHAHGIRRAFPYRPCYVDMLPTRKIPCSRCLWSYSYSRQ
ncbi:hypothetical protein CFC21_085434, partial [Triticum aestivum]